MEPRNTDDVLEFLRESADHETGEPTREMAQAIWNLMRHQATTRLLLAVQAWERGENYRKVKAELDASRATALEWFDRWVEAVRQGTSLSGPRHAHCSISTYEDAWAILGLVGTVTEAKFNEAVARVRATLTDSRANPGASQEAE